MQLRASAQRQRGDRLPSDILTSALFVMICAGVVGNSMPAAGEEAPAEVAYVEGVTGRVLLSAPGRPTLLDVLDLLSEQAPLGSAGRQRAAAVSLSDAAAVRAERSGASHGFARRSHRSGTRRRRRPVPASRPWSRSPPRRRYVSQRRGQDRECAIAAEHQNRRSQRATGPAGGAVGRRASQCADDIRERPWRDRSWTTATPMFWWSSAAIAANTGSGCRPARPR